MKHTPGPWTACEHGVIANKCTSHGNFYVASLIDPDNEEDKSNAQLIAAAPELLEACEWAYKLLCPLEFPGRATKEAQLGLCNLRDAIAKAKGQA